MFLQVLLNVCSIACIFCISSPSDAEKRFNFGEESPPLPLPQDEVLSGIPLSHYHPDPEV